MMSFTFTIAIVAVLLLFLILGAVFIAVVAVLIWQAERGAKISH